MELLEDVKAIRAKLEAGDFDAAWRHASRAATLENDTPYPENPLGVSMTRITHRIARIVEGGDPVERLLASLVRIEKEMANG